MIIGSAFKHGKLRTVCVCAPKRLVYIYQVSSPGSTVDTFFQQTLQDLRQEVVGHIEATLNATAGEVGSWSWRGNHRGKLGCYLGGEKLFYNRKGTNEPMPMTEWMLMSTNVTPKWRVWWWWWWWWWWWFVSCFNVLLLDSVGWWMSISWLFQSYFPQ